MAGDGEFAGDPMVHVIVFSKDRAFQLSQYIRTLGESSISFALAQPTHPVQIAIPSLFVFPTTFFPLFFVPTPPAQFPTFLAQGWGRVAA
jgi:hypothetical protein